MFTTLRHSSKMLETSFENTKSKRTGLQIETIVKKKPNKQTNKIKQQIIAQRDMLSVTLHNKTTEVRPKTGSTGRNSRQ